MGCDFPQHHSGGGWDRLKQAAAIVLAVGVAYVWVTVAVHPHLVVPWKVLAFCAVLAGCGVLSLAGLAFARWERQREVARLRAAEPVALRWRGGEPMREPRIRP